jgi:uncharacterized protein (DUF2267 family)
MLESIVDQVVQRTGISQDQARTAVDVVVSQLEQRLPEPIASQIRARLKEGGSGKGSSLGDAAKGLGDAFGR